ncbi:HlyD family efflux transporter periplasmic adaptor subunit [Nevskia sp.]|uniref:HlyD family efflux transporter periplasmic adaptor subunit n=1 Tax=Nevskia sp. TaxID=1929292 RepID=UPI0025FA3BD1|nr:HlyD family efflux transporter periplasmic adaptor subunit [Nevskia sp.]
MKAWPRRLLATITAVALFFAVLNGGRSKAAQPVASPAPAIVNATIVAAAPGWVDVQGGTRRLAMPVDGVVTALAAGDGVAVKAGAVLVQLDQQAALLDQQANALEIARQQQAVRALEGQLQRSHLDIARLQPLVRMQAEAEDVLRAAEASMQTITDNLAAARLALQAVQLQQQKLLLLHKQLTLRAPLAGHVLRIDAQLGESLSRGTPVVWFAPDAPLIVRAEVDEHLLSRLKLGMTATVEAEGEVGAGGGPRYAAKLTQIARAVGPVRALPEVRAAAKDDHVVECLLSLGAAPLLIGQRVLVRFGGAP